MDYTQVEKEIFDFLGENAFMVLATSLKDRVTARTVSCVIFDKKIYFQTDKSFLKYKQINENPKIALCLDNIQIEGTAYFKGHPLLDKNSKFCYLYKKYFYNSYLNYSSQKDEIIIEVKPKHISIWKYEDEKAFRDYLNQDMKIAYRDYYKGK